ncbi:MAG: UDP-N-acetylmuramoyl-tripeptide--D-alanyl-D-alanine ligase, partial [Firmicutes bacterium]|nr:UDP-N-acetylmuramoyl-tripeptide--D-alanyl-D-alanine ligase [Bacillota bacterium]
GISTDSRTIGEGNLFIPIVGEKYDGHDFIGNAIKAGAIATLSDRSLKGKDIPYIKVKDTEDALINIAKYYRTKFDIPAIAITGSSGKTTTKEMVAAVLSQSFNVLKNEGNYNNTIGLPHAIFKLNKDHDICVMEMGMNSFGEISKLASIVKPDLALVTNIGTAHIEFLGSRENIFKAKMEVVENFTSRNTLIINGDDDMLKAFDRNSFSIISVGLESENDIIAYDIKQIDNKGIEFSVRYKNKSERFYIPVIGIHNVYNGLFGIAAGLYKDMSLENIKKGLAGFTPPDMRMETFVLKNGIRIINDAYNANPESVRAAIITLANIQSKAKKILVLGDMMELGKYSENEHYKIGKFAACNNIDLLITIGERSKRTQQGALQAGLPEAFHFENNKKGLDYLLSRLLPYDIVLIKGSRSAKMEEIAYLLHEGR